MKTSQQDTGKAGEEIAIRHLQEKGLEVLATNWRWSRAEVDIIARDGNQVVFVEVKTRNTDYFGHPEEFVSKRQQEWLSKAAGAWLETQPDNPEIRFDIVSIILQQGVCREVVHIADAFFLAGD